MYLVVHERIMETNRAEAEFVIRLCHLSIDLILHSSVGFFLHWLDASLDPWGGGKGRRVKTSIKVLMKICIPLWDHLRAAFWQRGGAVGQDAALPVKVLMKICIPLWR